MKSPTITVAAVTPIDIIVETEADYPAGSSLRLRADELRRDHGLQLFGVRGIPTLMLFKNGNVEATKVGALSKSQLAAFLDSNI